MTNDTRRAVFFDRDGTVFCPVFKNDERGVWKEKGKVRAPFSVAEFLDAGGVVPGAEVVLCALRTRGFLTILATNQPDVTYGKLSREEWERIQEHATALPFDDVLVCFHGRDDGCDCKKPKPGMLLAAAKKWNIDLAKSYFVGDTESDTLAAKAAGCRSILIDTWYNRDVQSDYRSPNLKDACALVCTSPQRS